MDTQNESAPLDTNTAAAAFADFLEPKKPESAVEETTPDTPEAAPIEAEDTGEDVAQEGEADEAQPDEDGITIEVDGKTVVLSKEELAEAYKNGLRQSDYTKKTMEVAEQRKAAQAAIEKAQAERNEYGNNLSKLAAQLEGALQEQNAINWQELLNSDPVEYLKQQHLYQQRQAAYQENMRQQSVLKAQADAERNELQKVYLREQQDALLAKLPEWKDATKAAAEKTALAKYLIDSGLDREAVENIQDHRAVILARKAMLYDQMVSKANAASKKVQAAPQRVVRPAVGDSPSMDKRSSAFQRLSKSGKAEDAAALFANFI